MGKRKATNDDDISLISEIVTNVLKGHPFKIDRVSKQYASDNLVVILSEYKIPIKLLAAIDDATNGFTASVDVGFDGSGSYKLRVILRKDKNV